MFSKKNPKQTKIAVKEHPPSIVSADLEIIGDLKSDGDIQIDGKVDGDVISKNLTISSTAVIRGSIEAVEVVVAGEVFGQIKAQKVRLLKTSRITADIFQESLAIEAGAYFEGHCRHLNEDKYSFAAAGAQVTLPPKRTVAKVDATVLKAGAVK
jgi:cytoskeletal protein CcmA (bactofilin family)